MSFFCMNAAACENDAALSILSGMYGNGFIQGFLTEGVVASQVAPGATDLAPVLLGGLASVATTLALVMFFSILFTSLINSAQDGEAFGKGSSKVTIVIRFLFSIALLLPTPSGYCMVQVILMFLVLWSNGETNKLYHNVVKSGIVSNSVSFNAKKMDGKQDIYNLRGVATSHFKQLVCVNTLNAVYYGETVPPTDATHSRPNAGTGVAVQTSAIYLPSVGVAKVGAKDISPQPNDGKKPSVYRIQLVDRGGQISSSQDKSVCGELAYTIQDPEKILKDVVGGFSDGVTETHRKRMLGFSEAQQTQVMYALAEMQDQMQHSKLDHIDLTMHEVTKWAGENLIFDPTRPELKQDYAGIKWADLERKVFAKIENSNRDFHHILTSESSGVAQAMNTVVDSLTNKGWIYASGIRQRIIALQADIQKIASTEVVAFTDPSLSLMINDDRAPAVRTFINQLPKRFSDYMEETKSVDTSATPEQVASLIPNTLDDDVDSNKLVAKISDMLINSVYNMQRNIVFTMLRGEATTSSALQGNNSANPIAGLDDNVDVLSNIQRSGELMLIFGNRLVLTEVAVRTGMMTATLTTSLLPFGHERAHIVSQTIYYWLEKAILGPLQILIKALYILGNYMAVIIPSMPYFFFMTAVVAWFVHILQAMAGLPFWAVMHMVPDRTFVGSQSQGYVTVIGLFMRPLLTLVGLFFAFIMANPILFFVTDSFFAMKGSMVASTSGSAFMLVVTEFVTFVVWLTIYCTLILQVCYMIFGLAGTLPDTVLRWLGSGLSAGDWGASNASGSLQSGASYANSGALSGGDNKGSGSKPKNKDDANDDGSKVGKPQGGGGGGAAGGGSSGGGSASSTPANNIRSGADDSQSATNAANNVSANTGGGSSGGGGGGAAGGGSSGGGGASQSLSHFQTSGGLMGRNGTPMSNMELIHARAHDAAPKGLQTSMALGAAGGAISAISQGKFGSIGRMASQGANIAGHKHFAQHGNAKITDASGNHISNSLKGNTQGVVQSLQSYYNQQNNK